MVGIRVMIRHNRFFVRVKVRISFIRVFVMVRVSG